MPFVTPQHASRESRFRSLAAIAAIGFALTGIVAAVHGHMPVADGWHDAAPVGAASQHDDSLNSCSMCRLAHETSSAPVAPDVVSTPLSRPAALANDRCAITHISPVAEHSPRAPPCLASC